MPDTATQLNFASEQIAPGTFGSPLGAESGELFRWDGQVWRFVGYIDVTMIEWVVDRLNGKV